MGETKQPQPKEAISIPFDIRIDKHNMSVRKLNGESAISDYVREYPHHEIENRLNNVHQPN